MKAIKFINKMNNNEFTFEAIDNYAAYNSSTKRTLKAILTIADASYDDTAVINISELSKLLDITRQAIYDAIKMLNRDGVVFKIRVGLYKPNRIKIQYIESLYEQKLKAFEAKTFFKN